MKKQRINSTCIVNEMFLFAWEILRGYYYYIIVIVIVCMFLPDSWLLSLRNEWQLNLLKCLALSSVSSKIPVSLSFGQLQYFPRIFISSDPSCRTSDTVPNTPVISMALTFKSPKFGARSSCLPSQPQRLQSYVSRFPCLYKPNLGILLRFGHSSGS